MTGTIVAQYTIPIVVLVILVIWLFLVYYADSHPYWRGRRPMPQQLMTQLPGLAQVMGARPPAEGAEAAEGAEPGLSASAAVPGPAVPAQSAGPGEPRRAAEPRPVVPGQRLPLRTERPGTATGATAAGGRSPHQPS
jgi:hypothetical protein